MKNEIQIHNYSEQAGELSDAQIERAQRTVQLPAAPEPRSMSAQQFVPARGGLPPLPDMPSWALQSVRPQDDKSDGDFAQAAAAALNTASGGTFEHTSAQDRTRADMIRSSGYVLAGVAVIAGGAFSLYGWVEVGLFFTALGLVALAVQGVVHMASLRHSAAGVNRQKIAALERMYNRRLKSQDRRFRDMGSLWLAVVEKQMEHELNMEKERNRARNRSTTRY